MENKMTSSRPQITTRRLLPACFCLGVLVSGAGIASERDTGRLSLQKTVITRSYGSTQFEGEQRTIGPGDSIWRILIQEKGLSERRFGQYLNLLRALNPQIKRLDVLKVGDSLFVPLNPDEALGLEIGVNQHAPASRPARPAALREYRVKSGDALYLILRRELQIVSKRELATYVALVKDLNPQKKNWDLLREGEILRLPAIRKVATKMGKELKPAHPLRPGEGGVRAFDKIQAASVAAIDALTDARQLAAIEHLALLMQIIESLGNKVERSGQEVLSVKAGTIRIDKTSYPVIYNPKLQQKIVLDPNNQFPSSLRTHLEEGSLPIPVVSLRQGESLQDGVSRLLAHLGYQLLTSERPVVLNVGGVSFAARGNWVALAPEEHNKPQEIYVINLTGQSEEMIPDYLKAELSLRGLHMRDITTSSSAIPVALVKLPSNHSAHEIKRWPRDNEELVDAVLAGYGIAYGVADTLSIELRDGLRLDVKTDRTFDTKGRLTALFFESLAPEIKTVLQEQNGLTSVELELTTASRKEIIARLLYGIGEAVDYREHRFSVTTSANREHLKVSATGFLLPRKGLFLTDREIPQFLQRLFFEKGLEVVYFH